MAAQTGGPSRAPDLLGGVIPPGSGPGGPSEQIGWPSSRSQDRSRHKNRSNGVDVVAPSGCSVALLPSGRQPGRSPVLRSSGPASPPTPARRVTEKGGYSETDRMQCDCGGDGAQPEHALSPQHIEWERGVAETEAGFQDAVVTMAKYLGWKVYHTHDSRRSEPGFPDLVLVRDRILHRECKTDTGRVRPEQADWIKALNDAGGDAGIWRPKDWDRIERELT